MSEFRIYQRDPQSPAGPSQRPPRPTGFQRDEDDVAEGQIISRAPLPGEYRGRALEMIKGRGIGGCYYRVAGYAQPTEPAYVRSWAEEEIDEEEANANAQRVQVRRR